MTLRPRRHRRRSFRLARPSAAVLAAVGAAGLAAPCARAAVVTWTGGGADANWSTGQNWGGAAPAGGDLLVFDGNIQLTNHNNLSAAASVAGITFNPTA